MSDYPEHDKLHAIADESQACGEFLDWMFNEKGWCLVEFEGKNNVPADVNLPIPELLALYFNIDRNLIEQEKRAMLERLREMHTADGALKAYKQAAK